MNAFSCHAHGKQMVFHRQSETEIDSRPPYNFTLKLDIEPKEAPVANGQMSYRITNTINIYHLTPKYLPPTKMSGIGILRMPQLLHKMNESGSHLLERSMKIQYKINTSLRSFRPEIEENESPFPKSLVFTFHFLLLTIQNNPEIK